MSDAKHGSSAFPHEARNEAGPEEGFGHATIHIPASSGMSLRDYFAGQAMAGLLMTGAQHGWGSPNDYQSERLSINAYFVADAMLTERAKAGTP